MTRLPGFAGCTITMKNDAAAPFSNDLVRDDGVPTKFTGVMSSIMRFHVSGTDTSGPGYGFDAGGLAGETPWIAATNAVGMCQVT